MSSEEKKWYLSKKYKEYDDESGVSYKHRRENRKHKKSKHKHEYENCVILDANSPHYFHLVGRCSICGKLSEARIDNKLKKEFPSISKYDLLGLQVGFSIGYADDFDKLKNWCEENYQVFEVDNFNFLKDKYI